MKLFLPEIGNRLVLTKDWEFVLYWESRNAKLIEKMGFKYEHIWSHKQNSHKKQNFLVTMPIGTVLSVDRIYIRKGNAGFSSVSFRIPKVENKKHTFSGVRFWASLSDVNQIEFDLLTCNEETLNDLRRINDELKKEIIDPQAHNYFMNIVLGGKTLNMIRPQENTITYLREATKRLYETDPRMGMIENYGKVREFLGLEYRKLKVKELIDYPTEKEKAD